MTSHGMALCGAFAFGLATSLHAEIHVAPQRMDHPTQVAVNVTRNPSTHLYRYDYIVFNEPENPAGVDEFWLVLQPDVRLVGGISSPEYWRGDYIAWRSSVSWGGTEIAPFIPEDYVHDGHTIPPYGPFIQPGESMDGFAIQSFGAPVAGIGYTQTFRPLPWADDADELEDLPFASDQPEDNGFQVEVQVPGSEPGFVGNRRPAVDGFLVFVNLVEKDSYQGAALVVIRFGAGGEQVDTDSFQASLNREDVTGRFAFDETYGGWAAWFRPGESPLRVGSNVLLTSVEGTVPGTLDRIARDTDRVSFSFEP